MSELMVVATPRAKVAEPVFFGMMWAGIAVSLLFLIFRLFVELRTFRKLNADAYLVILAWTMSFGSAILFQVKGPALFELYAIGFGQKSIKPGSVDRITGLLRIMVPLQILFICGLWTIKLSLLLFFRRLGSSVKGHKTWWWFVLAINILGWVASIGTINFDCSLGRIDRIISYCTTPASRKMAYDMFIGSCAADLVTDCLLISVPVWMLWNVKIPLRKKILLMVVFSLSAIVMIVAVIRVALVAAKGSARDLNWHDWVFFWSNIEMTTSIIIACVASFRQLFVTSSRQRSRVRPSHSWECLSAMPESSVKPRRKCTSKRGSHGKRAVEGDEVTEEAPEPWIRMTDMIPPNGICVDHSISITTSNTGDEDRERMAPYTSIRSNAQV